MKIFIQLTDTGNGVFKYLIVPVGKIYDPRYDWLDFSEERLKKIVANFKAGVPAYPPPVNIEHESYAGKYGEIKDCSFNNGLEITVEPTEEGKKLIQENKFQYMSVEIENGFDKKTGVDVGEILVGAALTNRPAHPAVTKIELSDDELKKIKTNRGGNNGMTEAEIKALQEKVEKLEKEKIQLSDGAKEKEIKDLQDKLAKSEREKIELAETQKRKERTDKVEAEVKNWTESGVPPIVAQKAKEIILAEGTTGTIKLSDGTSTDILAAFGEMMKAVPKVDFKQHGMIKNKKIEMSEGSDVDKALDAAIEGYTR